MFIYFRIEIGPRDIENGACIIARRDTFEKITVQIEDLDIEINNILEKIQDNLFNSCMVKKIYW